MADARDKVAREMSPASFSGTSSDELQLSPAVQIYLQEVDEHRKFLCREHEETHNRTQVTRAYVGTWSKDWDLMDSAEVQSTCRSKL
ncbi:MAG: hypothetical protein FRX48_05181 [Lasallia pustulata]|uniref:Uncharacterized protein n=1 Tax=Lasallia pustulata TaxID=136370 RepID=A0A5M8PMV2_9LECA|nr:MAG: hypothetical protein FRX48_05181 [Lasallia pustulata]